MTIRRARRRRRQPVIEPSLALRILQFVTSWEGIIAFSVLIVLVVLVQGILRLPLPFDLGKPPPVPDAWGTINVPRGLPMKLVYIGDVSGGANLEAPGAKQSLELAIKERGAFQGTKVELQVVEDPCDPGQAAEKARELAQDPQVVGVITQACSASTLAARAVYEEAKLPYLSLTTTAPQLTLPGTLVTFRLLWNEKTQGRNAALYARQDLQAARALLLHDGSFDAEAVTGEFRAQFRAAAGQIVDHLSLNAEGKEWSNVLKELISLDADLVYFSGRGKTARAFLAFIRQGGYGGHFMVTDVAARDPEYLQDSSLTDGTYATLVQTQRTERYAFWKETYEKEYGLVGPLSAESYDAASILLQALEAAVKPKGDGTLETGRQRLVGVIRSLPYDGVTGKAAFDSNGDRAAVLVQILKMENGEYRQVK